MTLENDHTIRVHARGILQHPKKTLQVLSAVIGAICGLNVPSLQLAVHFLSPTSLSQYTRGDVAAFNIDSVIQCRRTDARGISSTSGPNVNERLVDVAGIKAFGIRTTENKLESIEGKVSIDDALHAKLQGLSDLEKLSALLEADQLRGGSSIFYSRRI